jgi:phosphoglycolate phosphatase-like HAD superfamily hydrolase
MRVVLFDIDGTILSSGGVGRIAMERAMTTIFGSAGATHYRYDGKTDRQIVRESMKIDGLTDEQIDAAMDGLLEAYVSNLHEELASPKRKVEIFPGVLELFDALERESLVTMGLLTGNIHEGAKAKLGAAGIDISRFKVNAFGSDHEHRPELPGIAQSRAGELLGAQVAGDRLIVIGDTPADVRCGESIGAKAIGVATGRFTTEELASHGAYAVFETLADTHAVMEKIMNA